MTDLREFLKETERHDEIVRIRDLLSVKYEIPEALRIFDGDKVVFIENVKEHDGIVVGGVCGTRSRILRSLEVDSGELYNHLLDAVNGWGHDVDDLECCPHSFEVYVTVV